MLAFLQKSKSILWLAETLPAPTFGEEPRTTLISQQEAFDNFQNIKYLLILSLDFGLDQFSLRKNGGVEGTRTLGLPRDRRTL